MVIAGDTLSSNMVVLMEGRADPSISMPFTHGQWDSIAEQDIQTIKLWIEQGAKNNQVFFDGSVNHCVTKLPE